MSNMLILTKSVPSPFALSVSMFSSLTMVIEIIGGISSTLMFLDDIKEPWSSLNWKFTESKFDEIGIDQIAE